MSVNREALSKKVEAVRQAQAEFLRTKPHHVPVVLCPECGRLQRMSTHKEHVECTKGHRFENPHFQAELAPIPPPAPSRRRRNASSVSDSLSASEQPLASLIERFRNRPAQAGPGHPAGFVMAMVLYLSFCVLIMGVVLLLTTTPGG